MNDFDGLFTSDYRFKPQGKAAPMAAARSSSVNNAATRLTPGYSNFLDEDDPILNSSRGGKSQGLGSMNGFGDVFGGPPNTSKDDVENLDREFKRTKEEELEKQTFELERMKAKELEREEKERKQRRLEREKERAREEREKARQAVERATREARDRAAADARIRAEKAAVEKANSEARERAERLAVQRAQAEARERATAARSNAEAKERTAKAENEARVRAEKAAVERAAREARERAAAQACERAAAQVRKRDAATRANQQKPEDDLEFFFGSGSRPSSAPRASANNSDSLFNSQFQTKQGTETARRTSSSSSSIRKASSTTNIVDDLSSIFGGSPQPGSFQEVEGETEEVSKFMLIHDGYWTPYDGPFHMQT